MRSLYLVLVIAMLIGACSDSGGGGGSSSSKDLFSKWERTDGFTLDLTGMEFNKTISLVMSLEDGEICQCDATITGSQSSGEASVANCTYQGGGSGDPDCPALGENSGNPYTYTKSGVVLTFCDAPSSCGTFK